MPFFYIFAINMEKVYPTVQVRETNIVLMSDGRGGIFFFVQITEIHQMKKLLPPHLNHHKHRKQN